MTVPSLDTLRDVETIFYIAVFVGVLLVFAGIQDLVGGRSRDVGERNRRMRMIRKGIGEEEIFATLVGDHDQTGTAAKGPLARTRQTLRRAGLSIDLPAVAVSALALGGLLYFALSLRLPPLPALGIAVALAAVLPVAIIDALARERVRKLTTQLPEALDMMARGLRIGHPLNVTLRRVAQQMPDPIGTEFGLIEDRIRHGADIAAAIAEFAARFETEDTHYFAACVAIQHGTGGNLGQVLRVLSGVIRDRINMRTKIRAVSGEGRISAVILSLMPFLIVGAIHVSTPSYYAEVMDHPLFMPVAWVVLGLVVLQALVLRRLATFDF